VGRGNPGGNDASAAAFCCARALDSRRRRPLSAWSTGHRQANNARETEEWTTVSASQGSERAPGKLTELAHMSAQRFSGQSVREIQPRQWFTRLNLGSSGPTDFSFLSFFCFLFSFLNSEFQIPLGDRIFVFKFNVSLDHTQFEEVI
jgi:hypothetical protein